MIEKVIPINKSKDHRLDQRVLQRTNKITVNELDITGIYTQSKGIFKGP